MSKRSDNEKIGQLIAEVRQMRGLTQTDLAKRLNTSQSAVNRIEKGNQNVSIEMLGRISEVLNKQIIRIAPRSINFRIEGGRELKGEVTTNSSKNANVALLCASLLNYGTTRLCNVPRIEEVFRIIEVLKSIGVKVRWDQRDLEIKRPAKLDLDKMDANAARKTRSVLMFMGPLMHEFSSFKIPYAGGCKLGERTVQPHLFALEKLGAGIEAKNRYYHVHVGPKTDSTIVMYEMSETATENVIMAAARTPGKTTIKYASHNYMVRDVCYFLQKLGIRIDGVGTNTLVVHGRKTIKKNISYAAAEDPIEAMGFLTIAAMTKSSLTIKRCPIDFLELELLKLQKMGLPFTVSKRYKSANGISELVDITTKKHDGLTALSDKLHSFPYPAINMDNLPYFAPLATIAKGKTLIHDWSYENRAIYFTELNKLGASVTLADPHRVYIDGPSNLKSADIVCPPALRPAFIIMIAMMAAEGTSMLRNVYSITRGYESLAQRLAEVGANIEVINDM